MLLLLLLLPLAQLLNAALTLASLIALLLHFALPPLCTALLLGSSAALQEMHVDAAAADRCVQLLLQQMPQCRCHYNINSSSSIGAYRWEPKLIG